MHVKEGSEDAYAKYLEINAGDEYSKATVDAGERIGALLDEGNTAEEALKGLDGHGLSGYMAAMAVKGICHFHVRGEELRVAWNKDWGAGDLKKGIVNPAILNVGDDGKMSPEIESV